MINIKLLILIALLVLFVAMLGACHRPQSATITCETCCER